MLSSDLQEFIEKNSDDAHYQTVEVKGERIMNGYSQSYKTWATIQSMIDWKGKNVLEVGPFHAYFLVKLKLSGASSVIGYERCPLALSIAKKIIEMNEVDAKIKKVEVESTGLWLAQKFDVILALNMLHHVDNWQDTIPKILSSCSLFLFEGPKEDWKIIKSKRGDHLILNIQNSHRDNRVIGLLGKE